MTKERRAHVKSHFGCAECKEKRVKCDERRPKCSRCTKRKDSTCTYGFIVFQNPTAITKRRQPSSSVASSSNLSRFSSDSDLSSTTAISDASSARRRAAKSRADPDPGSEAESAKPVEPDTRHLKKHYIKTIELPDWMSDRDRQLYYYYNDIVCADPVAHSMYGGLPLWANTLREHAPKYPFVLAGILTLASFHYALAQGGEESRRKYFTEALQRQFHSIKEYRTLLADLEPESYEPALAFAGVIILTAFASSSPLAATLSADGLNDPIHDFSGIISLFRGMGHLYRLSYKGMAKNSIGLPPALQEMIMTAKQSTHAGEPWLAELEIYLLNNTELLAQVNADEAGDYPYEKSTVEEEFIDPLPPIFSPSQMYLSTIKRLRLSMRRMAAYPGRVGFALVWPSTMARQYEAALQRRRPLAILLLAYWAAGLYDSHGRWWINDFGKRVVLKAQEELGPELQPYLKWPLEYVAAIDAKIAAAEIKCEGKQEKKKKT